MEDTLSETGKHYAFSELDKQGALWSNLGKSEQHHIKHGEENMLH